MAAVVVTLSPVDVRQGTSAISGLHLDIHWHEARLWRHQYFRKCRRAWEDLQERHRRQIAKARTPRYDRPRRAFATRTNQGWGVSVSNHRGNGRLIENISAGTWAPGSGLEAFDTAGWPDSRAGFVLEALGSLDLDTTVTSMPDEVRGWITHAATA